jgi:hypothetical protein
MRNKIIAVNAAIVLIVGLLSFVIVRQSTLAAATNPERLKARTERDAQAVSARLQLDGLRIERWLSQRATEPAALEVFNKASDGAKGDAATAFCDSVAGAAKSAFSTAPSLVAFVDANGKLVGRNGSPLERGDDLGAAYPLVKASIAKGVGGSDVWTTRKTDKYVVSYAPVRDASGKAVALLVLGMGLNDAMAKVSDLTSGTGVAIYVSDGKDVTAAATSNDGVKALEQEASGAVRTAVTTGNAASGQVNGTVFAASAMDGFGDGKHVAALALGSPTLIESPAALAWPVLGATVLGLVLVIVAGGFLGSYISTPINTLEEGLLAIVNGQSDKRFNLEHEELGGLAFRIDQLLNALMGVEEDNSDEEGRLSHPPSAKSYQPAQEVEAGGEASALASEPAEAYYLRLYGEYIAAKKALGEPTDHITEPTFRGRIQSMEAEASQKHGRPVRYQVKRAEKEVQLLAVPLS